MNMQPQAVAEQQVLDVPSLENALSALSKQGGFDFLESVVDGVDNLNPARKAKRNIFKESSKKAQRAELRKRIQMWVDLLANGQSSGTMAITANEKAGAAEVLLKSNLKKTLQETRELEEAYRTVHQFYKNTETPKLKNVVIMNAALEKLKDTDDPQFIEFAAAELKKRYDKLDMRQNYSLMVIPGYLGSNMVLDKWSKMAYENKVMLVTDFVNAESPAEALSMFNGEDLTSADPHKANVIMTCNYLVGRGRKSEVGEEEDLYVPGSAALAGKMYCTKMSQPVAGKTYGLLDEVEAVRFDQQKGDISELENVGLVPLVGEWGRVMPFSAKTLFTGDNLGMKTYSVVRVFDFIAKVLSDFLNRRAFELWNTKLERNLRSQIVKFLDGIQGPDKLIEKFQIIRFERDEDQKDRIFVDIHITPFFPAKSFLVMLDGYKGDDGEEWKAQFKQQ